MRISWLRLVRWLFSRYDGSSSPASANDVMLAEANELRDDRRWVEAAEAYARYLTVDGANPAIHVQHAHALKEAGRHWEAAAAYARAIALAPDDSDAVLHRAHLLKRLGDPAALHAFRRLHELDGNAVSAEELSRLEALFGDPKLRATIDPSPSHPAAISPTRPAARIVAPLPPGLHPRRRAVRFVADVTANAPPPMLRVMIDGHEWWSGEIETRPGSTSRQIDSVFSFPEPDYPIDGREVRVEALSEGIAPARASLSLPYAARFEGHYTIMSPGPDGKRSGTAQFVDREDMTITPHLRAMDTDGALVPIVQTGWKREGAGFEISFTTAHAGALKLYPMWSTQELAVRDGSQCNPDVTAAIAITKENEIFGRIVSMHDGHVEGWALRPGQLGRTVIVDLFADGILIGCGYADLPRADLATTIGGAGRHGFSIALPCGVPENAYLTAHGRGNATEFAASRVPARAAGILSAAAQEVISIGSPLSETSSTQRTIAALLLCEDDTAWRHETARAMDELGVPVHRVINSWLELSRHVDAAIAEIEQDLVLVLSEATIWDKAALAPMEQALAASQAVLAVPILQPLRPMDVPGAPDRWGWSLYLSSKGATLRPSPPSPWLEQAANSANVISVAGADWPLASLIDRRRWQAWGGLNRSSPPEQASSLSRTGMIATLAGVEMVLAAQATVQFGGPLPTEPVTLPDGPSRQLAQRLRKYPLLVGLVSARPPVIALLITTIRSDALEGDAIVAREFASALSRLLPHAELRLIPRDPDGGADLTGIDTVICLRDDCDPRRFRNLSPSCRVVFWIRNCFDAFLQNENWRRADEVWMSSERECTRFHNYTGFPARLLRIATNLKLFEAAQPDPELACDICFTGSFWGIHREIAISLVPEILDASVRIFGVGWEAVPELAAAAQGPAPYSQMPAIYASAKLVIDDANHVTVNSGSVNSRVYDAIAAGTLPITNGIAGAHETFGELLPIYQDAQSLTRQIRRWLEDESGRQARVAALRRLVMEQHGFEHRARDVIRFLSEPADAPFIAITGDGPCPGAVDQTPPAALVPLMAALARAGWRVDWIPSTHWDAPLAATADIRLHVGASPPPAARPGQSSIAWILSDADTLSARIIGHESAIFVPARIRRTMPDLPEAVGTLDWAETDAELDVIVARFACLR